MKKKEGKLLDHNYDGIQEYDNDLPQWWKVLFYLTIVFSFIYVGYFHFGSGKFLSQQLDEKLAELTAKRGVGSAPSGNNFNNEEALFALLKDPAILEKGKNLYMTKCLACHGDKGQGTIGPNLTDDYWIHGGKISEIKKVVVEGVLEKGMIAWGAQMPDEEINQVVAYIWTLHGTNPANPKAAQGDLVVR